MLLFYLQFSPKVKVSISQINILSYKICDLVIRIPVVFFKTGYMQSPYENLNSAQFYHQKTKCSVSYLMPGVNHAIFLGTSMLKGLVLTWKAHPSLLRTQLFMKVLLTNANKAHFYRNSIPAVLCKEMLHFRMCTLAASWLPEAIYQGLCSMSRKQLKILGRWDD